MKISASDQVAAWLTALPPQTKKRVRSALRNLTRGHRDVKGLQGDLEGFSRLRIGGIRILYRQTSARELRLEYANTRDVAYEMFRQFLSEQEE